MSETKFFPFAAAVGIDTPENYMDLSIRVRLETRDLASIGNLAVGLLMSEKTGLLGIENRHGSTYPTFKNAKEIVRIRSEEKWGGSHDIHPLHIIVHYNTDHPELVSEQLERALGPIAAGVDAMQINSLKFGLDSLYLRRIKEIYPDKPVILQIHESMLTDNAPRQLARKIDLISESIDAVWLDASGGQGKELDASRLMTYIDAIQQEAPSIESGVAGGLTGDNVKYRLRPFIERFASLSWDGQKGIQDATPEGMRFSVQKSTHFLIESALMQQHLASKV